MRKKFGRPDVKGHIVNVAVCTLQGRKKHEYVLHTECTECAQRTNWSFDLFKYILYLSSWYTMSGFYQQSGNMVFGDMLTFFLLRMKIIKKWRLKSYYLLRMQYTTQQKFRKLLLQMIEHCTESFCLWSDPENEFIQKIDVFKLKPGVQVVGA